MNAPKRKDWIIWTNSMTRNQLLSSHVKYQTKEVLISGVARLSTGGKLMTVAIPDRGQANKELLPNQPKQLKKITVTRFKCKPNSAFQIITKGLWHHSFKRKLKIKYF